MWDKILDAFNLKEEIFLLVPGFRDFGASLAGSKGRQPHGGRTWERTAAEFMVCEKQGAGQEPERKGPCSTLSLGHAP